MCSQAHRGGHRIREIKKRNKISRVCKTVFPVGTSEEGWRREEMLYQTRTRNLITRVISLIIIYERPVQGSPTAGLDLNAVE